MKNRPIYQALTLATLLIAACTNKDAEITPEPAGAAATAGAAGAKPVPTACRTDRPGAEMVLVPKPGGAFCIDKTEATRQHYAEFLRSAGEKPTDTRADCKDDTTHRPFFGPKSCTDNSTPLDPKYPTLAVACVDWCDARAFCEWAGKRLCEVAPAGTTKDDVGKAGEWNLACSVGGKRAYPYGDAYERGRCRDKSAGLPADGMSTLAPGTAPSCAADVSPYDQLQDLSGGLYEWAAGCHKSENGTAIDCPAIGGSFADGEYPERLACWTPLEFQILQPDSLVGIRCCADD